MAIAANNLPAHTADNMEIVAQRLLVLLASIDNAKSRVNLAIEQGVSDQKFAGISVDEIAKIISRKEAYDAARSGARVSTPMSPDARGKVAYLRERSVYTPPPANPAASDEFSGTGRSHDSWLKCALVIGGCFACVIGTIIAVWPA